MTVEYSLTLRRFLSTSLLHSNGKEVSERIRLDVERANSLAVEGTPTVFLNGTKLKLEQTSELEQFS